MKIFLLSFFLLISNIATDPSKMLIIYFTRTGNTEKFANYIKEVINIDSYKIEPMTAYPDNYNDMLDLAQQEINNNARPEIKNPLTDISKYDTLLVGYPLWYGHLPNIVINQLEKLDLKGKTIYPFNTHGSSGIGNSINDMKSAATQATVKEGFPISQSNIQNKDSSIEQIRKWVNNNKFQSNSDQANDSKTNIVTDTNNSTVNETFDVFTNRTSNYSMIKISYLLYFILNILL